MAQIGIAFCPRFGPGPTHLAPKGPPSGPKRLQEARRDCHGGHQRTPRGLSPRGPTMPFWLNFGRWFPGGSANFALHHLKKVADLSRCLPRNLRHWSLQTRRRGTTRLVPSVSPATYDVVMPITIYNIESANRWLQNRFGKIHTWFHEDGAEIQDAYTFPV